MIRRPRRPYQESQEPFGGRSLPENIPPYDPVFQPDIVQVQKQQRENIPLGSPFSDSRITSTFDARPINSEDFIIGGQFALATPFVSFTVPDGLIAIVRWFSCHVNAVLNVQGIDPQERLFTITVDGVAGKSYNLSNIASEIVSFERYPCYVLAGSNTVIRLTLDNVVDIQNDRVYLALYGNLLVSSGRPLTHEPGVSLPAPVYTVPTPTTE